MDKRFAIFDMDGTLVDSMPAWRNLGRTFLTARGIPVPADLRKQLMAMTMVEAGAYFNTLGVSGTPEEIVAAMNESMHDQYKTTILPCVGIEKYLDQLVLRDVRMCVATATDSRLAATCLDRLGLSRYFEFVVSCEDVGEGKSSPRIYQLCAERLGAATPSEVAVFEDAPYAARTAHEAGFYTIGIYDACSAHRQEELRSTVDEYITDYPSVT